MQRDLKSNIAVRQSLKPAARQADAVGAVVDLREFDSAAVVVDVGAWADGAFTFTIKESDTGVVSPDSFTAVADADLDGTEPVVDGAADDDQQYVIGYKGGKRYLRVDLAEPSSPNPTALACSAAVILSHAAGRPTA